MNEKILEILYRSFDEKLNHLEQNILDKALQASEELRVQKEQIERMRSSLKDKKENGFSYMFADKVMRHIKNQEEPADTQQFVEALYSTFRPFAIAATLLIIFLVSYNIIIDDTDLFSSSSQSTQITLAEAFDPFNELTTE
jgi:DNA repair protein RadC